MDDVRSESPWSQIAELRPRLKAGIEIRPELFRGRPWHVLRSPGGQRFFRVTPELHGVLVLLDGRRTVQEVWDLARSSLSDSAPGQVDVLDVLRQLQEADLLELDCVPDTDSLLERACRRRRRKRLQAVLNPLFLRLFSFDPDRLLERLMPLGRVAFARTAFWIWLGVVGMGLLLAIFHWVELTENLVDRILAPQNLVAIWLVFLITKALHELGHALAVKVQGGEVHSMGVSLLVFTPVPYVDASDARGFPRRRDRILVSAAGMMVELLLAALALAVWVQVEPGWTRAALHNVIVVAGISTVIFNANPLLRFDGYYILSELLEIPNLGWRARKHVAYLAERALYGVREVRQPPSTPGERRWLVLYFVASSVYRAIVLTGIVILIAGKFFFLGVALAVWSVVLWVGYPIGRWMRHLLVSPTIAPRRARAIAVSAGLIVGAAIVTCVVPAPLRTVAEGVVVLPEESLIRAAADGFVVEVTARPGATVVPGDPILFCANRELEADIATIEAELAELEARADAALVEDPAGRGARLAELGCLRERLAGKIAEREGLVVRSRTAGRLVIPGADDLPGRFLEQGAALGQVVDSRRVTARVVVPQEDIDLVRNGTRQVLVIVAQDPGAARPARIVRGRPGASRRLPSLALSTAGGGAIPVDPRDGAGRTALQNHFEVELELDPSVGLARVGGRVFARFDHAWEPLIHRCLRGLRRLFLSEFGV